jgi:hypothetical protein
MMAKNKVSVDNRRPADLKASADGLMTSVNPRERPDWVRWPDTRRRTPEMYGVNPGLSRRKLWTSSIIAICFVSNLA